MLHLVLYLTADNRASILIVEPLQLLGYLMVEALDNLQIFWVVRAYLQRLGEEPVGQSATAYLTVTERADTYDDRHLVFLAKF